MRGVTYYGFSIDFGLNFAPRIRCPLVLHLAEKDPQIPPEAVTQIKAELADRPETAVHLYPRDRPGVRPRDPDKL